MRPSSTQTSILGGGLIASVKTKPHCCNKASSRSSREGLSMEGHPSTTIATCGVRPATTTTTCTSTIKRASPVVVAAHRSSASSSPRGAPITVPIVRKLLWSEEGLRAVDRRPIDRKGHVDRRRQQGGLATHQRKEEGHIAAAVASGLLWERHILIAQMDDGPGLCACHTCHIPRQPCIERE